MIGCNGALPSDCAAFGARRSDSTVSSVSGCGVSGSGMGSVRMSGINNFPSGSLFSGRSGGGVGLSISSGGNSVGGVRGGQVVSQVRFRDVVADPRHHGVLRGRGCVWGHDPHSWLPA